MCGHHDECGCRMEGYHRHHDDGCGCGCHSGIGFRRRFSSRAEQVEALKAYL